MSFNGSFGDGEFVYEEENSNIISLRQEDFKISEMNNKKLSNINSINNTNNEFTLNSNSNNIFCLVPMEMEIQTENQDSNNFYDSLLSKELLNYHLSSLFNILKSKIIIINSQTFYLFKRLSSIKYNNLLKAEIVYLKISDKFERISNIFKKKRKIIIYQIFISLKTKLSSINRQNGNEKGNNSFINKYEEKYKKEKDIEINENNNYIIKLEEDIKDIEKNIENLSDRESRLMAQIRGIMKKERKLNDKIKTIKNSNNSAIKSIQTSNISSISPIPINDSEMNIFDSNIIIDKQLKEGKKQIIKSFMEQINNLINEYQSYIDNINNINN